MNNELRVIQSDALTSNIGNYLRFGGGGAAAAAAAAAAAVAAVAAAVAPLT